MFFSFLFFFEIFIFGAVIEGKRTKNSPKWKLKLHPSLAISQEQYSIYQQNCKNDTICRAAYLRNHISYDSTMVHLCKMMISPGFFFIFVTRCGGGGWSKMRKNSVCCTPCLRNHASFDFHLWCQGINHSIQ